MTRDTDAQPSAEPDRIISGYCYIGDHAECLGCECQCGHDDVAVAVETAVVVGEWL